MRRGAITVLLGLAAGPVAGQAPEIPAAFNDILAERQAQCAAAGGELALAEEAVARVDLSGEGAQDWVLDERHLDCGDAAPLACGTGGCPLHLLVGESVISGLAKGWDVADLGPIRTVLLQVHGARCGGIGADTCVEALVWSPDRAAFLSVAPAVE